MFLKESSPLHGEIGHLTAQIKISTNFSVRYHVGILKTRRNRLSSFKKFPRVHQKISSDRRFLAIFKLASQSLRFFLRIDLPNSNDKTHPEANNLALDFFRIIRTLFRNRYPF